MVRSLLDEHEEKKRGEVQGRKVEESGKASASEREETTNANEQIGTKEIEGDRRR